MALSQRESLIAFVTEHFRMDLFDEFLVAGVQEGGPTFRTLAHVSQEGFFPLVRAHARGARVTFCKNKHGTLSVFHGRDISFVACNTLAWRFEKTSPENRKKHVGRVQTLRI